jgi:hypothetical protein
MVNGRKNKNYCRGMKQERLRDRLNVTHPLTHVLTQLTCVCVTGLRVSPEIRFLSLKSKRHKNHLKFKFYPSGYNL